MKTKIFVLLALLAQVTPLQAQILLFDDFEDGVIDTNTGRGALASVGEFSGAYQISGRVTLNHEWEIFGINLRTDLSNINRNRGPAGVSVIFLDAYDVRQSGWSGLAIMLMDSTSILPPPAVATSNFALEYGQPYDFTLTDTGSLISLSIDGVERLSYATNYSAGGHIAFSSREWAFNSSSLDYVSITAVPVPSTFILLGSSMLLLAAKLFHLRRKTSLYA